MEGLSPYDLVPDVFVKRRDVLFLLEAFLLRDVLLRPCAVFCLSFFFLDSKGEMSLGEICPIQIVYPLQHGTIGFKSLDGFARITNNVW